jgi:hypothetical protein
MDRREFIKTVPALAAGTTLALKAETLHNYPKGTDYLKLRYPYFVNCYIQNQKYWPLEVYKGGSFKNGKLYFGTFQGAVDFINNHSLVTPFYDEALYEVFHEKVKDQMVPPKHIFNYWVKLKEGAFPETIKWIHPDYIDHTADGALIEYV